MIEDLTRKHPSIKRLPYYVEDIEIKNVFGTIVEPIIIAKARKLKKLKDAKEKRNPTEREHEEPDLSGS